MLTESKGGATATRGRSRCLRSGLSSSFLMSFIGISRGETPRVVDHRLHLDVARMSRTCLTQRSCGDQNTLQI